MKLSTPLLFSGIAAARASTQWEDKLPLPSRPLVFGEVNFIHSTDIHGERLLALTFVSSRINACFSRMAAGTSACKLLVWQHARCRATTDYRINTENLAGACTIPVSPK